MKPNPAFFVTGGTLRPDALCYVERQADRDLYQGIRQGQFCYVLTPRQMGKSSLMVRTVVRLRREGYKVAVLDLTSIGQNLTPEQWYDGLIGRLGQQLELEEELLEHWRNHSRWGPLQRWISAIDNVLLSHFDQPLAIFIDEIDTVRSLPFSTDEFFAAIRECYNRRAQDARFERLTFGLLGVATPTDLIRDPRLTPFNIGRRIEVHDFTQTESQPLSEGLSSNTETAQLLLRRVLYWTGGQPFLTQRLCRSVADALHQDLESRPVDADNKLPPELPTIAIVDQVCSQLFLSPGARERDDNLVFVRQRILSSDHDVAALLSLYRDIRRGKPHPDNEKDPLVSVLKLSGLVHGSNGVLHVRNRIYRKVFDENWIRSNMPEAEMRRQRMAFHRGIMITVAAGFAVLAVSSAILLNHLRLHPLGLQATLPDGTVLTLDAVDFGRRHYYEPGRFRTAWIPRPMTPGGRPPKPSFELQTTNDALGFWITRQDASSGAYLNFDWWSHFELVDSHGCVFFGNQRAVQHDRTPTGSYDAVNLTPLAPTEASFIVASGAADTFPRREPTIRLRLYNYDQQVVATFEIPNPVYRVYPVWRPEPLPQTRQDRDLTVTLTDVQTSLAQYQWHRTTVPLPLTRLSWHAFYNGALSTEWEPSLLTLLDATGNRNSILPLLPAAGLCTNESAWTASLLLYPGSTAAAQSPSHTWKIGTLTLAPDSDLSTQPQERFIDGLKVQFRSIAGPGRYRLDQGRLVAHPSPHISPELTRDGWFIYTSSQGLSPVLITAGKHFLTFHIDNQLAPPAHIDFRSQDDAGQPVHPEVHRHGDLYFIAFPEHLRQLRNASLTIRRPRQLEFRFQPPLHAETTATFQFPIGTATGSIRPRDPDAPLQLIDLSPYYNASLVDDWHRQIHGNDLARLPQGIQRLGNVNFDVRGIVQLAGTEPSAQRFPRQIQNIRVGLACTQLHFLHGSGWNANRGAFVGQYLVRYADESTESIPLVFGRNIGDWWFIPNEPAPVPDAEVVWAGANSASLSMDRGTRLYKFTWRNPRPNTVIDSIDFLSGMGETAPFLIAITAE